MKYGDKNYLNSIQTSGTTAVPYPDVALVPWQPSTWPAPDGDFLAVIEMIFQQTIIDEIQNVINDALETNGSLEHRGHVVSLAMLCAVDTFASYAYSDDGVGARYKRYIEQFFPTTYQPHAKSIYNLYRNSVVHSWNLFEAGMLSGTEGIRLEGKTLYFGLLNFFEALRQSLVAFIDELATNKDLERNCKTRYDKLRSKATA